MKTTTQDLQRIFKKNLKFWKSFAQNYPQYYDHPLLDENEAESFLMDLRKEFSNHPDATDPFPNMMVNITEENILTQDQNVLIYPVPPEVPSTMHYSEYFELRYIQSGNAILYSDEYQLSLSEGNILLIPPKVKTCLFVPSGSKAYNILIRPRTINSAFFNLVSQNDFLAHFFTRALYGSKSAYILWKYHPYANIERIIHSCEKEFYGDQIYCQRMIEILLMELFIEILRIEEIEGSYPNTSTPNSEEIIRLLIMYFNENGYNLSLSSASEMFNYSERQLERIIKQYMGGTFSDLKRRSRMERANALLKNNNLLISDIAIQLGYENSNSFIKAYKKEFSLTPSEYRSKYLSESIK